MGLLGITEIEMPPVFLYPFTLSGYEITMKGR
jgi:hypothetical protein